MEKCSEIEVMLDNCYPNFKSVTCPRTLQLLEDVLETPSA